MRISDWSSDVCSSDLRPTLARTSSALARASSSPALPKLFHQRRSAIAAMARLSITDSPISTPGVWNLRQIDRKSVVSGKSVSVRVDLGGRRNIKKKHIHRHNKNKS